MELQKPLAVDSGGFGLVDHSGPSRSELVPVHSNFTLRAGVLRGDRRWMQQGCVHKGEAVRHTNLSGRIFRLSSCHSECGDAPGTSPTPANRSSRPQSHGGSSSAVALSLLWDAGWAAEECTGSTSAERMATTNSDEVPLIHPTCSKAHQP